MKPFVYLFLMITFWQRTRFEKLQLLIFIYHKKNIPTTLRAPKKFICANNLPSTADRAGHSTRRARSSTNGRSRRKHIAGAHSARLKRKIDPNTMRELAR